MNPIEYSIETPAAADTARRRLARHWVLDQADGRPVRRVYLDSFDWRLHRAGLSLTLEDGDDGRSLYLHDASGVNLRLAREEAPVFADELPPGVFHDRLAGLLEMRALLRLLDLHGEVRHGELRDDEGKIRVRLAWQRVSVVPQTGAMRPMLHTLSLEPLRGYQGDLEAAGQALEGIDGLVRLEESELSRALRSVGRQAGDYDTRLRFEFEAACPAHEAFRQIMQQLVSTMRRNEPGILADRDSEFLHDFRVAVRRTRSLLAQMKPILPAEALHRYREGFAWLGTITGPCRDLDVYLLGLDGFRAAISPRLAAGIDRLEPYLEGRKAQAHDRLVAELGGPRYRDLLADWRRFLRADNWPAPNLRGLALGQLVAARAARLRRRILRAGARIDTDSPAERLHELRKECKKYRYLLEMFGALLGGPVKPYVRALKRLQELLGDFQDCDVQLRRLPELADDIHRRDPRNVATLMAMGALVEEIDKRMARLRRRFHKTFDGFVRTDQRLEFEAVIDQLRTRDAADAGP